MTASQQFSRKELSRARQALRQLAARTPQSDQLYGILTDLGRRSEQIAGFPRADQNVESWADAEVAIIGTAYVEYGLELALRQHFMIGDQTAIDKLFKGDNERPAVLSDFANKIDIAYGLGVLSSEARDDLHTLRLIRNSFAHSLFRMSLQSVETSSLMKHLHLRPEEYFNDILEIPEMRRLRLAYIIAIYYSRLISHLVVYPRFPSISAEP